LKAVITRFATPVVLRKFVFLGFRNAEASLNIGFSFVTRIPVSVNEATRDVRTFEVLITRVATPVVLGKFVFLGFRNAIRSLNIGFAFVTRIAVSVNEATRDVRTFEVSITRVATLGVLGKFVFLGFRNAIRSLNIGFAFVTRIAVSVNEATRDVRIFEVSITRVATLGVLGKFVFLGFRNAMRSLNIGFAFVTRIPVSVNEATRRSDRRSPDLSTLIGDLCRRFPLSLFLGHVFHVVLVHVVVHVVLVHVVVHVVVVVYRHSVRDHIRQRAKWFQAMVVASAVRAHIYLVVSRIFIFCVRFFPFSEPR